jgi:hypothetical protein
MSNTLKRRKNALPLLGKTLAPFKQDFSIVDDIDVAVKLLRGIVLFHELFMG